MQRKTQNKNKQQEKKERSLKLCQLRYPNLQTQAEKLPRPTISVFKDAQGTITKGVGKSCTQI